MNKMDGCFDRVCLLLSLSLSLSFRCCTVTLYSKHPNTEPWSVFGLNLMPVPGIRISNRPKTGRLVRFASLDRFIVIKNIFFMPKRSRLVRKCPVRISNGRTKWRPFCFYHLKTGLFRPDFKWSTSLDRFIKKRVMNKIFLCQNGLG